MIPVCATLLLFGPAQFDTVLDAARPHGQAPARVGPILIEGNTLTHQRVILNQLGIHPGQVLRLAQLEQGRRNLIRLGLFDTNAPPTVTIIHDNETGPYHPVRVQVKEMPMGRAVISAPGRRRRSGRGGSGARASSRQSG